MVIREIFNIQSTYSKPVAATGDHLDELTKSR